MAKRISLFIFTRNSTGALVALLRIRGELRIDAEQKTWSENSWIGVCEPTIVGTCENGDIPSTLCSLAEKTCGTSAGMYLRMFQDKFRKLSKEADSTVLFGIYLKHEEVAKFFGLAGVSGDVGNLHVLAASDLQHVQETATFGGVAVVLRRDMTVMFPSDIYALSRGFEVFAQGL